MGVGWASRDSRKEFSKSYCSVELAEAMSAACNICKGSAGVPDIGTFIQYSTLLAGPVDVLRLASKIDSEIGVVTSAMLTISNRYK